MDRQAKKAVLFFVDVSKIEQRRFDSVLYVARVTSQPRKAQQCPDTTSTFKTVSRRWTHSGSMLPTMETIRAEACPDGRSRIARRQFGNPLGRYPVTAVGDRGSRWQRQTDSCPPDYGVRSRAVLSRHRLIRKRPLREFNLSAKAAAMHRVSNSAQGCSKSDRHRRAARSFLQAQVSVPAPCRRNVAEVPASGPVRGVCVSYNACA